MSKLTNKLNRKIRAGVDALLSDFVQWNRVKLGEAKIKWYHDYHAKSAFVGADLSGTGLSPRSEELAKIVDDPPGTPPQELTLDEEGFDYADYLKDLKVKTDRYEADAREAYRLASQTGNLLQ